MAYVRTVFLLILPSTRIQVCIYDMYVCMSSTYNKSVSTYNMYHKCTNGRFFNYMYIHMYVFVKLEGTYVYCVYV